MQRSLLVLSFQLAALILAAKVTYSQIESNAEPFPAFGSVERLSPQLDSLLSPNATMEKLAEGFDWSEGPSWDFEGNRLLFSDIPRNTAYQWSENKGVSIFLSPSGFTGEYYAGREPGSNGLAFGPEGQLHLAQHGDRRIARLNDEKWGFATVANQYQDKRFNSPNDLCFDSKGNLYFTDPPYGLGKNFDKELEYQGVYRVSDDGSVTLLTKELSRPNGIAISPDEKTLYVANSDQRSLFIMSYPILEDFSLGEGEVFFDPAKLQSKGRRGLHDGLRTDVLGNVWATAPGGVIILSPTGEHLGSLLTNRFTANCAFGGPDGTILYITADDVLCRIQTNVKGFFPFR